MPPPNFLTNKAGCRGGCFFFYAELYPKQTNRVNRKQDSAKKKSFWEMNF